MRDQNQMVYTYYAFISYKREDEKWAKWIHKKLESYGFPVALRNEYPKLPSKIRPIFRDQSELSGGNLKEEIEKGLHGSKYLIVICSPRSAQSPWVSKEVQYFIDNGREKNIIPFIIGGSPFATNQEEECFPEGLRKLSGEKEILGININEMGRDAAAIKVIARMFGLRFDTLWHRHERAKRRKVIGWGIVAITVIVFMGIVIQLINIEKNKAIKQERIAQTERKRADAHAVIAQQERDKALKANADLMVANDSISKQSAIITKANRDLYDSNLQLASERDKVLKANQEMLENRARWVSNEALKLIAKGDVYRGIALILNVQPLNSSEPFVSEIEQALRVAQDSIDHRKGPLCILKKHNGCVYSALSNSDWKYIVTGSNDYTVRFWDTKTGQEIVEYRMNDYKYNSTDYMALGTNNLFVKRIKESEDEMTQLGVWEIDVNGPKFINEFPMGYLKPRFNHDGSILTLESYNKDRFDTHTADRIHYNTSDWRILYKDSIKHTSIFEHVFDNLIIREDYPVIHVTNIHANKSFDLEGSYDGVCLNESIIMTHLYSEGETYLTFWNLDGIEIDHKRIYVPSDIRVVIENASYDNLFIGTQNGEGYIYRHPFRMEEPIWRKLQVNKKYYFHNTLDYRMMVKQLDGRDTEYVGPVLLSQDSIFRLERFEDTGIMVTNTINNMSYVIKDAHDNRITSLSVVNDQIISTSFDHTVRVWEIGTGKELAAKRKVVNGGYYTYGLISNDKKYMATSNGDQIFLYNYNDGILLQVLYAPDLIGLTFSNDSSALIYKSNKDELNVNGQSETLIWKYIIRPFNEILDNYKFLRDFEFSEDEKREYLL